MIRITGFFSKGRKEQRKLDVPTLIAWDKGDIFFDVKWLHCLEEVTPATLSRIKLAPSTVARLTERFC